MTALTRNRLAWAAFMLAGLCFGLAGMYISNWFVIPFFANVFGGGFMLNRIVCPNCGAPLTYEGPRWIDRVAAPSAWWRKNCAACGWDLSKNP